jgi:hypothetical protein
MEKTMQLNESMELINKQLKQFGLLEIALVSPNDCLPQKVNARYFKPEIFKLLVDNVKRSGHLESAPLVYRDADKYRIISGHHRVDAAKAAGLEQILVFITEPKSKDDIVSKQLSHNSLTGEDDNILLTQLFSSIQDIELKFATGLVSQINKISYESINFNILTSKELTFLFIPTDIETYDKLYNEICEQLVFKASNEVRLTNIDYYEKFGETLRRVKKVENIKSNGSALLKILELAQMTLDEIEGQI